MKRNMLILAALSVMMAGAEDKQAAKKAAAKKNPPPAAELTLPAGAVQVDPGTYTYTDSNGKKWTYRKTPFGLSRTEDKPGQAAVPASSAGMITATEAGDKIKFERPG